MFSRTTASPSESGVVAFMTSTLSCDDWNSDANWSASLVASFLCGPPDQPPAPPTYLIETCACTARSRAAPLRESSARRSAGAAPRCPKAESTIRLPDLMTRVTFTFTFIRHLGKTHNHRSRGDTPWRAQSCDTRTRTPTDTRGRGKPGGCEGVAR